MNKFNRNYKRLSLWILLLAQMLLIMSYFYLKVDSEVFEDGKISFVPSHKEDQHLTYHSNEKLFLKSVNTRSKFVDFNSSLCYLNGTDLVSMNHSSNWNWQCKCLPGWHGKDCGQPEVIWRAFLKCKKAIKVAGPRTFERRIIYIFQVDKFSDIISEIRVHELAQVVDLFILYEDEESDFLLHKLNNFFLKKYHHKILYTKKDNIGNALQLIQNLRDDDVILSSSIYEIVNKFAISFLKLYNDWPEPIYFRMKWSVFGFFWLHPSRTFISGGACSVAYLRQNFEKIAFPPANKTSSFMNKGMIIGDLNHYGGWYCQYCSDIAQILELLSTKPESAINLGEKMIDSAFLEDVIENGLYIDGKTELVRTHRYHDNYYAPYYVSENHWQYDFLLTNLYSKIDYYEG